MVGASAACAKLITGNSIPLLGFGTVYEGKDYGVFKDALKAALLVAGYRHIDTAWYYYTEKAIGEALEEIFEAGKLKREDLFITTKVWPCFWNDPETSLKQSLTDLKLDHVDLVLQHWPVCFEKVEDANGRVPVPRDADGKLLFAKDGDYLTTYKKLLKLKDAGLAKAVGVSNYTIEMLDRAIEETGTVPACNQVELHPHLPQIDLYNYCAEKGIILEAYSPFGSTGAPNMKIPLVVELAEKYHVSPADILVNYCITKKIVVLPRSSNIERVKRGYPLLALSKEEIDSLDAYGVKNPKRFVCDEWGKDIGFDNWD